MEAEIRTLTNNFNVSKTEDNEMIVEGYALRFNTWSENLGKFKETISPSALRNLKFDDVRLLFNHDWNHVLARQSAGNLDLEIDDVGLRFKATLPNTSVGKDVYESIRAGNINQCSFEFNAGKEDVAMTYDANEGIYKRTVNKIQRIREISIVSLPAYKSSNVSVALRNVQSAEKQRELDLLKIQNELLNL